MAVRFPSEGTGLSTCNTVTQQDLPFTPLYYDNILGTVTPLFVLPVLSFPLVSLIQFFISDHSPPPLATLNSTPRVASSVVL